MTKAASTGHPLRSLPEARPRTSSGMVFGYSVFESSTSGLETEMTVFVATDAPVKLVRIKVRNRSGRPRRLSVHGLLGVGASAKHETSPSSTW